jgi:tetratricopeptide (TPR) repeat protein
VSAALADLLARCLAADPARRYPSGAALAADLRRHLADLPLRGVRNRSPAERWYKWRRRRPAALPLLGLAGTVVLAAVLLVGHLDRQRSHARAALHEGQRHLDARRYGEALGAFQHGAELARDLPLGSDLQRRLEDGAGLAERARAAGELHNFSERLRPLYGEESLASGQARELAGLCREVWERQSLILRRLREQPSTELQEQVRADLLDLAIVWSDLRARQVPGDAACREAVAILARAEELFGPSCVLLHEQRRHDSQPRRRADRPPRTAWEHYALGRACLQAGRLARAARYLDRAIELQPNAPWASFERGKCACRQGQFDDAVVAFTACIVLSPQSAWCRYHRGRAYRELGKLDHARRDLDSALRLDPALAAARLQRGVLNFEACCFAEALADLDGARAGGISPGVVLYNQALVHLERQDRPTALACLRAALRHEPGHDGARRLLARLLPP